MKELTTPEPIVTNLGLCSQALLKSRSQLLSLYKKEIFSKKILFLVEAKLPVLLLSIVQQFHLSECL
jgi:hypothetical protein